jgi:hypothetical protein
MVSLLRNLTRMIGVIGEPSYSVGISVVQTGGVW